MNKILVYSKKFYDRSNSVMNWKETKDKAIMRHIKHVCPRCLDFFSSRNIDLRMKTNPRFAHDVVKLGKSWEGVTKR